MTDLVDSRVERVTLFEDRAEVVRSARVAVAAGTSWVAVSGISVFVDDASLVASAEGEGRVIASRVRRALRQVPAAAPEEIAAIERDLVDARGRRVLQERALARAQADGARVDGLAVRWERAVSRSRVAASGQRPAWERLDEAAGRALDEAAGARLALERARLDEQRAQHRLEQARATSPRYAAHAEVQVESGEAREVDLRLVYRVPAALWRPEHTARLDGDTVEITSHAVVWQRTGEDWRDVRVRLSTARPTQQAAAPRVQEDRLRLRKKLDKTVHVEVREQQIQRAGVEGGAREVEEMPGVDDGGEPRWYEGLVPVTLPSDGHPVRIALGVRQGDALEPLVRRLPAKVELVAYPERTFAVHRKATATLSGGEPLLAGPVRVARRDAIVGRGKVTFVAPGEPFELGFGADDTLRVRRRVDDERETSLTGRTTLERTVSLFVSNLGAEPRSLVVIERIPVSEIGDVSVTMESARGGKLDAKDGFVRFPVEVPAGESKKLELEYRVEWPSKVSLVF